MSPGAAVISALAFALGAVVGGVVAWRVRGRRAPAEAGRHYALRVAGITALVTLIVAAGAAYLTIRVVFRSRPVDRASTDRALEEFRRARGDQATLSGPSGSTPTPGVYTYRSTGFFDMSVPLLGTEHRDLPESVPAVLMTDGSCWEQTVRYFEQHRWTTRFCRDSTGTLRIPFSRTENVYFGRDVTIVTTCQPELVLRADMKAGDTVALTCDSENNVGQKGASKMDVVLVYVGPEEMTIGEHTIQARHFRREVTLSSRQKGSATRDLWYAPSGLLLRLRSRTKSSGITNVNDEYELVLTSLTPGS